MQSLNILTGRTRNTYRLIGPIFMLKKNVWKRAFKFLSDYQYTDRYPSTIMKAHEIPGGGTQIWKWRTSAYRRTKIGCIQCKITSKKGVIRCGHQKNGGFFGVDSQKWGSFSVLKCNFKAKFANFLLKLPQNR